MPRTIEFQLNDKNTSVATDSVKPLLDVLREDLGLTGTKYGCGEGECGACTVLMDGVAVRSCITSVGEAEDTRITTIEGLADGDRLHPVQQSFLDRQAMQCGYCVPGQIMNAVGMLNESPRPTRTEILDAMNGNLCRCCNYANILAAVEDAVQRVQKGPSR